MEVRLLFVELSTDDLSTTSDIQRQKDKQITSSRMLMAWTRCYRTMQAAEPSEARTMLIWTAQRTKEQTNRTCRNESKQKMLDSVQYLSLKSRFFDLWHRVINDVVGYQRFGGPCCLHLHVVTGCSDVVGCHRFGGPRYLATFRKNLPSPSSAVLLDVLTNV
jgi:hypothetical protein